MNRARLLVLAAAAPLATLVACSSRVDEPELGSAAQALEGGFGGALDHGDAGLVDASGPLPVPGAGGAPPTTPEDGGKVCPQEGLGCTALIIQFIYNPLHGVIETSWLNFFATQKMKELKSSAEADGCKAHYYDVASGLRRKPERRVIRRSNSPYDQEWDMTVAQEAEAQKKWKADMDGEATKLRAAIDAHVAELKAGRELGIFSIYAHGSQCGAFGCGGWDTGLDVGSKFRIRRDDLEPDLYTAARRNVCEQVVLDNSCYAGCSALLGGSLNKAATVSCTPLDGNCCNHAGWRGDLWLGASKADSTTWHFASYGPAMSIVRLWRALDKDVDAGKKHQIIDRIDKSDFLASYSDKGYGHCCP